MHLAGLGMGFMTHWHVAVCHVPLLSRCELLEPALDLVPVVLGASHGHSQMNKSAAPLNRRANFFARSLLMARRPLRMSEIRLCGASVDYARERDAGDAKVLGKLGNADAAISAQHRVRQNLAGVRGLYISLIVTAIRRISPAALQDASWRS